MLAVKFYNLRALIHRPLLSPTRLLRSCPDPAVFCLSEHARILSSKRKCVSAAQHTAQLLYHVEDTKSLVYGFPWWQMISCLICASSILLVASICMQSDREDVDDIDWIAVDEDADVCLTVFQALSSNSNAARLARDMMQGLKETRIHSQGQSSSTPDKQPKENSKAANCRDDPVRIQSRSEEMIGLVKHGGGVGGDMFVPFSDNLPSESASVEVDQNGFDMMLYEVSDPIMWSARFVDAAYNPFLGRSFNGFNG